MEWWEILLIVAIISFVVFMFSYALYRKKKGRPIGGGCEGKCSSCGHDCASFGKKLVEEYHKCNCK